MPRGVAPKVGMGPEAGRRARMREQGFRDGRAGSEKAHTDPEYLTSYRRGREAAERDRSST